MSSARVEADDFRRLVADAKKFDREVAKNLRRGLRAAAKPMADAAKRAALDLPSQGKKSTGLRRALARSVTIEVSASKKRAGVAIKAKRSKMPPGQYTMPFATRKPVFRHPVFGHPDRWVSQKGAGWFDGPISSKRAAADRAVSDALRAAERAIGFK